MRVRGVGCAEDALHAFRVVDVLGVARCTAPKANSAVVRSGDEVFARGREGDVHDGGHVVFEHIQRAVHFPDVEDVDVVVFVGDGEIEGFHWVPG